MKIQSTLTIRDRYNNSLNRSSPTKNSLKFLGKIVNDIPKSIQEAISNAINSANLKGRDKLIIPHALLMSAKIEAEMEFHTSISNLNMKQWKQLAQNTLTNLGSKNMNLDPKNIKTRTFLEYFIAYLQ